MKRAYNVRSKVTHGDVLSPKQVEELPLIAGECDNILRHCLKTIVLDDHYTEVFDSKNDVLEDFFFQLLFPTQTTGGLLLRIDPRRYFAGVDFSQLPADTSTGGYAFSNDPSGAAYSPTGYQLYTNLHQTAPYTFSWSNSL